MSEGPAPLRVLLLVASEDDGGAARSSYLLARSLPEFGVETHVVVHRQAPLTRRLSEAGLGWTEVPELIETGLRAPGASGVRALFHHGRNAPRLMSRIAEIAERERASVLYGQGTWTNYVAAGAAQVLRRRGATATAVWHIRNNHSGLPLRMATRLFAHLTPLSAVIAVSRFAARPYDGLPCPVHVVLNGVEWRRVEAARANPGLRRILGFDSRTVLVGYAGRFVPRKGVSILVDAGIIALRSVPSLHLVLLGDTPAYAGGDVRAELQARFVSAGVGDRVHFPGYHVDIEPMLADFDVLVVPSIWGDPCPRVAVEGLSLGVPVIGSDIGGIPEIVRDGVDGVLVPAGDASKLAAAIVDLAGNPEKRRSMGEAAERAARERFDAREVARNVADVLKSARNSY